MRAILLVLILAIVALIIAIASGFINLNLTRGAEVPQVSATGNGVSAQGGQVPAFEVETGSVKVGTKDATVKVPTLEVQPAADGDDNAAAAVNSDATAANTVGM